MLTSQYGGKPASWAEQLRPYLGGYENDSPWITTRSEALGSELKPKGYSSMQGHANGTNGGAEGGMGTASLRRRLWSAKVLCADGRLW